MDDFVYRDGQLYCEAVPTHDIAVQYGTPVYVYSQHTLLDHFDKLSAAFAALSPAVCFSVKSCSNLHILRLLAERGAWFDVVSGGELQRVLEAGAGGDRIVFAGVGKTYAEMRAAVDVGIAWFNVESEEELEKLISVARATGKTARAALRINPDVDPHTHVYTTTGKRGTKFGLDLDQVRTAFHDYARAGPVELSGIHLHIGSPVNKLEPYVRAITKTLELIDELRDEGFDIEALNIGGGYGAHYEGCEAPPATGYAACVVPLLTDANLSILLEPGRSIAANAGILLTQTVYVKQTGDRRFIIVDAAMTDLLRPALYGAYHFAWPVWVTEGLVPPHRSPDLKLPGTELADVVGGVCESADFLAKDRWLPPIRRDTLMAIFSAGAYGFSMSSQYNSRPRAAEVLIDGDASRLIRRRETYDDLVAAERL